MPELILILGLTFGLMYFFMISSFTLGFHQLQQKIKSTKNADFTPEGISIVIAFRNEAPNMLRLINSLIQQQYPKNKYEIILVNDHSEDTGAQIAEKAGTNTKNLNVLHLPKEKQGKKAALQYGISKAKYELILTTDADCLPGRKLLATLSKYRQAESSKMILLPVVLSEKNWFQKLQSAEFMSLTASAAGSASIGFPILSNGAGMAAEKKYFNKLKGYIASGDDMFLLHNIKNEGNEHIKFLLSKEAAIVANATNNLKDFIAQRLRWVSKFRAYDDAETIFAGLLVFLTNLLVLLNLTMSFFSPEFLMYTVFIFLLKIIADTFQMILGLLHFKKLYLLPFYVLWIPIYPFYSVIIGIWGQFSKKWLWKKRPFIQ